MKVLHVVTSLNRAGLEKLIYLLCCRNNSDAANDFMLLVLNDAADEDLLNGIKRTKTKLVELKRRPGKPWNLPRYLWKARRVVTSYRPDVVHVHNRLSFVLGFLASRFLGASIVYTLHDTRLFSSGLLDQATKRLAKKGTDRFIAISESVKNSFISGDMAPDAVTVVPNCIDLEEFAPSRRNASVPIIVCVARLDHLKKGQDILIEALAMVRDRSIPFQCQLIGEGPSRAFLDGLVGELGLSEEVRFTGVRSDVAALLSGADLFVLPSRYEGFGIVILEAMASGLPVIVSNIEGPAEVVQEGKSGLLFKSGDACDLAEKVETLLVNRELSAGFAKASLHRARDFSIEVMYQAYLDVYSCAINSRRMP